MSWCTVCCCNQAWKLQADDNSLYSCLAHHCTKRQGTYLTSVQMLFHIHSQNTWSRSMYSFSPAWRMFEQRVKVGLTLKRTENFSFRMHIFVLWFNAHWRGFFPFAHFQQRWYWHKFLKNHEHVLATWSRWNIFDWCRIICLKVVMIRAMIWSFGCLMKYHNNSKFWGDEKSVLNCCLIHASKMKEQ